MPTKRHPKQRYVQWIKEAPVYSHMDIRSLNGYFNWTMDYRTDSDFYAPYGYIAQTKMHPVGQDLDEYIEKFGQENKHLAKGKSKKLKAAWFVSNCHARSRREKYVKELKNYMDIGIYGKCGTFDCSRKNSSECYLNMAKEYKFYLSFENSACKDYVTEKYFNVLKYNVIPVVYGGNDYHKMGPYKGFISALDFSGPKALAQHLKTIHNDDSKYAEHMWWKPFYEIRRQKPHNSQPFCELCKRLNNPLEPNKVYDDMYKWWITDANCFVPKWN